jgi:dipeptide transport system permease protein
MGRFLAGRLGAALVTILAASLLAFVILRALPTSPAALIAGPFATAEVLAQVEAELGLDRPLPIQYVLYVTAFVSGDWGFSYSAGQPVRFLIAQRLPASAELALFAFAMAFVAAIVATVLVSFTRSRLLDGALRLASFASVGVPPFWISLLLLIFLFERLGWFPGPVGRGPAPETLRTGFYTIDHLLSGDWRGFLSALNHLFLPGLALALGAFGYLVRLLRANLLDVAGEPFVTVLHAKGVAPLRAHVGHVLPNAFLPTLTAGGLILAQLIGGSVLVERIFTWPGVGSLVIDGILRQDYAVVQAFILLSAAIYIAVSVLVDLAYGWIDPRVRRS